MTKKLNFEFPIYVLSAEWRLILFVTKSNVNSFSSQNSKKHALFRLYFVT